jgi:hypothetical protein
VIAATFEDTSVPFRLTFALVRTSFAIFVSPALRALKDLNRPELYTPCARPFNGQA